MSESSDTVFPVPEGISSKQWPCNEINLIKVLYLERHE